jgi:hypothetical protein
VTSLVTVDKDEDTATGPFTTAVDAANLQATVSGTVVLTRIKFELCPGYEIEHGPWSSACGHEAAETASATS